MKCSMRCSDVAEKSPQLTKGEGSGRIFGQRVCVHCVSGEMHDDDPIPYTNSVPSRAFRDNGGRQETSAPCRCA